MNLNEAWNLIMDKIQAWFEAVIKMLPNLLLAAVVVVLGIFIAKYVQKLAYKIMDKISLNSTLNNLFGSIVYAVAVGIVIFTALSILKLDKAVTTMLAGAGVLGLALAFAFQDIAANFMSGVFISFRKPINIGDIVKIKDYMGKVVQINLRDSVIRTFQGQLVIIPNKEIFQNPIENYSMLGKRRIDLDVGISYGENLEKVKEITLGAVENLPGLAVGEKTTLYFNEFGDSSINFTIRIWTDTCEQPGFLDLQSEAIIRIKKAYDKNDIMIPFPIRTLDFGIKGGVPINKALEDFSFKNDLPAAPAKAEEKKKEN